MLEKIKAIVSESEMARIALKFEEDINLYSNTTMRHIREYLKQIGKWELALMTKAKLFEKLEETNYIILDIL